MFRMKSLVYLHMGEVERAEVGQWQKTDLEQAGLIGESCRDLNFRGFVC